MKNCVYFEKKNGEFTVVAENGKLKTEPAELSYIKHNLLCFGRADNYSIAESTNRNGCTMEFNDKQSYFSKAWIYFLEGSITPENVSGVIREFNKACDRDLRAGLFNRKIFLKEVTRIDKNTLVFKIDINGQSQTIKISI